MKVYIRKLYNFIKINCSLLLCYSIITIFIVMMVSNYLSNKQLNIISRGFLTLNSKKFNVSGELDVLDLEEAIIKNFPKEGAIFRKNFNSENIIGIYKNKEFNDPPLIKGRFLDENESFSTKKIAVVGQGLQHSIRSNNGKDWIEIDGINYEVIGIIGTDYDSRLDSMIFIPLGVVNRQYDIKGEIIIDGIIDIDSFIEKVISYTNGNIEFNEIKDTSVMRATFDPITGKQTNEELSLKDLNKNYVTSYIYFIVFLSALICIISISIYWMKKIEKEITVCNIIGFYKSEIFIRLINRYIKVVFIGSLLGGLFSIICLSIL